MIDVRVMVQADLASCDELRQLAGWNQTPVDCRSVLELGPDGCFVATDAGRVVGTVTTTVYGRALAWIGMMLVHPEHRRKGIATRLMIRALEHLRASGIQCIKLDATPAGRPLYEQLGFIEESNLTRWQKDSAERGESDPSRKSRTRGVHRADWLDIDRLDAAAFGIERSKVLREFAGGAVIALGWPEQPPLLG